MGSGSDRESRGRPAGTGALRQSHSAESQPRPEAAIRHDSIAHLQRTFGNQAVQRAIRSSFLASGTSVPGRSMSEMRTVQRLVVNGDGTPATVKTVRDYIKAKKLQVTADDDEIEEELKNYRKSADRVDIGQFLEDCEFVTEDLSEDQMDVEQSEWDPSEHASEPLDPLEYLSSTSRKGLSFSANAKAWMKIDTPKKNGQYICHICNTVIKQTHAVDMDHLPAFYERLQAHITHNKLTVDDVDELSPVVLKGVYNMRGSVFAHSSCNRGHAGELNYRAKWGSAVKWYAAGGGAPF